MKKIFLTFDDGPSVSTEKILQILKDNKAKATFFVCGDQVEKFPDILKKIKKEGHSIGNHSYNHSFFRTVLLSDQIEKANKEIEKVLGEKPKLFRSPWGLLNFWSYLYLRRKNLKPVWWDIAGEDWKDVSSEYISRKVISKARDGSIVLLHDGLKSKRNTNRKKTIEALKIILPTLKKEGYSFLPL